jgi:hypothetical protein
MLWRVSFFEPEGHKIALLVATLEGEAKNICQIVWDILSTAKNLFTLHTKWNQNVRCMGLKRGKIIYIRKFQTFMNYQEKAVENQ